MLDIPFKCWKSG